MTTKLPSIPIYTGDNTAAVIAALSEALQVRTGQRGDTLDAGVTFRDLATLSLVQNTETTGGTGGSTTLTSAGLVTVIPNGNPVTLYDGSKDLTTPPSPTGLKATAVFGTVLLSWNQSAVLNISFTEVYKSFTNDVTTAVLTGTSSSQFFTDNAGANRTIFYWVRTVSQAAVKSAWNGTAGTAVTTTLDPAVIIQSLEGQVLESSLSQLLSTKIGDAYEGSAGVGAKITAEKIARTTADSVLASSTNAVSARLNNIGGVTLEQNLSASASTTGGLSAQYTVKIDANGHMSGFGLASTVVNGTPSSAFIIRADKFAIVDPAATNNSLTNTPSADTVPFFVESGTVYIKSVFIKDASITNAKIGTVTARKITSGYTESTIGLSAAKLHGAEFYAGGSTTVTYDGEGFPSGMSTSNPTFKVVGSDVEIVAANFKIKQNAASGTTTPFEVVSGVVRITNAVIGTGTITSANIADTIQSNNWNSSGGLQGWQINKAGTATFNQATIRATIASADNLFVIDMANKFISISV